MKIKEGFLDSMDHEFPRSFFFFSSTVFFFIKLKILKQIYMTIKSDLSFELNKYLNIVFEFEWYSSSIIKMKISLEENCSSLSNVVSISPDNNNQECLKKKQKL